MKQSKTILFILMGIAHLGLVFVSLYIVLASFGFHNAGPETTGVTYLNSMSVSVAGKPAQEVSLPHSFQNLESRTPVTFTTTIYPDSDDTVYIKSVYAPAKIYLDDKLCYEFGKREDFPGFMVDPATEVHMVETHGNGQPMNLRMEFLSPAARHTLSVQPPIVGTSKEVILERSHALGIPFILSLTQIIYGLSLLLISACLMLVDKKGVSFLWLGLLSFTTGIWAFGENNFTGIIFKNSTLLYLISFLGFFSFIIPLLRFTRTIIDFEHPRPIWLTELFMVIAVTTAVCLQLTGTIPFSASMFFFHLVLPLILVGLSIYTSAEYLRYKNVVAGRFILPISVLALSAVLELMNYELNFTPVFSSLFQMGILFFLLVMGVTAGLAVKDSVNLKERKRELNFQQDLMDIRNTEQESYSHLLSLHEQRIRQQRHDLRHHLDVISELAGDCNPELQDYLQTLRSNIPKASKSYCENRAVNAIVSHYAEVCSQKGIEFTIRLAVPRKNPNLSDSNLCVIFGNLLENAVEACGRIPDGPRFIKLNSRLQYDLLTITMDNSFCGKIRKDGDRFRSSKRDDFGIGISSIQSVARKSGGNAKFKTDGQVFLSSVYVKL